MFHYDTVLLLCFAQNKWLALRQIKLKWNKEEFDVDIEEGSSVEAGQMVGDRLQKTGDFQQEAFGQF